MAYFQETLLPSVDELNIFEHGRFVLSNIAAKRAKQIKDGAPPLVDLPSAHPLSLALAEISSQKIKASLKSEEQTNDSNLTHEVITESSSLGLLLPSLDDLDVQNVLSIEDEIENKQELIDIDLNDLHLEETLMDVDQIDQENIGNISLNELEDQELLEDLDNQKDLE